MKNTFLSNYSEIRFIDKLCESIKNCNEFYFSVSFIKIAGLDLIKASIEEALMKGVKGRIITTSYKEFTDVVSLRLFLEWQNKYPNFKCHFDLQCFGENGFHSKGYLFKYENSCEFLVGSTNITRFALLKNIEWNVSIESDTSISSFEEAINEFDYLWSKTLELNDELINKYVRMIDYAIDKWDMDTVDPINNLIRPNTMQRIALKEIQRFRDMGVNKSLVVSATASGKTYLSAFDARNFGAKRVLFIAHRDKILNDSLITYAKVFGPDVTYGLFVGKYNESDKDFVFASNVKLHKHINEFSPTEFDYIVFDECHHITAGTYKDIMNYFKPEFTLGITATPERMDNQDVFEMFDKNVPYELRLRDAIINDIVVPFHYYGIRDKLVDYGIKDNARVSREIAKNENINFIVQEINKHLPNNKLKAIAFCINISHAQLMAEQFNAMGFNAVALTGRNDLGQRIKAFSDLQDESNELKIICAVDILNEGVDLPSINMVLFLRPTESSTIFIQQLGRGLRKYDDKEFLTVLDFIGNNYNRSIQIALALGNLGNSSIIEKPYLADLIRNDFNSLNIPGVLIDIDELSKEEMIDSLENDNFNKKEYLIKDYQNFKIFLKKDTYPNHVDFLNNECAPNLMRLINSKIDNKKNFSYYEFLRKIGEDSIPIFDEQQTYILKCISSMLPLVRVDEFLIVKQILNNQAFDYNHIKSIYDFNKINEKTYNHAFLHLKEKFKIIENSKLKCNLSDSFIKFLMDLLDYGLQRYQIEFDDYNGLYKLYGKYSSEQIQIIRLKSFSAYMQGTEFNNNECYCYVTLHKDSNAEERLKYKDKFINSKVFQWESVKNTTKSRGDGPKILRSQVVYLFVRKITEEDGITMPFIYFGKGKFSNVRDSYTEEVDKKTGINTKYPTLMLDIELENEVPKEMHFEYDIK